MRLHSQTIVEPHHLRKSLETTRPSVPIDEFYRLQKMYVAVFDDFAQQTLTESSFSTSTVTTTLYQLDRKAVYHLGKLRIKLEGELV